jgi:hypothetical protein
MQSKPSLMAVLIILLLATLATPLAVAQRPEDPQRAKPVREAGAQRVPDLEVLWNQPLSAVNQNAYRSQEMPDWQAYSTYLADDFVNVEPWLVDSIFVPGTGMADWITLMDATALTWQIYADSGGVPAGDPSGGGSPAVWTLTLPPDDPQVVITSGSGGMLTNVQLTLAAPAVVPAGHWWLVFYPTLASAIGAYGRQPADTFNGYAGQVINPGGGFGFGTTWTDWSVLGPAQHDIAFRIDGSIVQGLPVSIVSVTYLIDGLEVAFDATVEGDEPITYAWQFGDGGSSGEEDPVHTYAQSECYVVTLTASNPYGPDDSWTDTICVGQQNQTFIPLVIRQRWSKYYEPNDRCEDAYGPLAFGQDYLAYPDDQEDYYTFLLPTAGTVDVTVSNYVPTTDNGQLLVYGPAVGDACGEQVGQFGEPGLTAMWINDLSLGPGTYHVRIRTEEGDFPRDELYRLRVTQH